MVLLIAVLTKLLYISLDVLGDPGCLRHQLLFLTSAVSVLPGLSVTQTFDSAFSTSKDKKSLGNVN